MTSGSPLPAPNSKLLEHFRSDRKRLPLHPLEKAVLAAVAIHLCFLPWALGTMHPWSQITSLVLSTLGILIALIPRNYTSDLSGGPTFRLHPWARLVRFPIFWIGLALLAYIAVQGYNPSWVWERNEHSWWLRRVNDLEWLPTSIDTPFERFNLWRQFIIYAAAWLTVCTVWIGFTRRRSLQLLLTVLVINAVLLAAVGFFQKFAGLDSYLFLMKWPEGHTAFASFIYRNHAGPYFALMTFLSVALAIWVKAQGDRAARKSTPASLFFLCGILLTSAAFFSLSRGTIILITLTWGALLLWFLISRRFGHIKSSANPAVMTAVVVIFVGVLGTTVRYMDFSSIYNRFEYLAKYYQTNFDSVQVRLQAHDAARTMLGTHWQRGVGAGGFRFLYPEYIKHKPDIYNGGRLFWEHAHNDWLEIPIELGATGMLFLLAGGWYWLCFFVKRRSVWHSLAIPVLLGCSQTLVHAWFDFPFQNPAILTTWLALVTLSGRWVELDSA